MTKTEKILAAYERFGAAIAAIPDERAQALHRTSVGAREFIANARAQNPRVTASQVGAGLEQGLRETPGLIQGVAPAWRAQAAAAFHNAVLSVYPEFMVLESERLKKVLARGKIRSEAEFHRVRYEIDLLEGDSGRKDELSTLYALVDSFEARA
ncbi:hypothetical protein [Ramlibacter albus]|uniref:Uncharacterized protein n=1 Tax=Ramlibacter albus TaxID=2079448 RepID=A0A923MGA6_9BURK|nr:hypothetical protein [Ramlibacter albus]MBC5768719.1 hypothetical protein [Ramlibacter albus]